MSLPVQYLITGCPLGRLLVAGTTLGVTTVGIGQNNDEAEAEFLRKSQGAQRADDSPLLQKWATLIIRSIDGEPVGEELPLDVRGTDFQWLVWRELMRIPYGATHTYGDIARSVGKPDAARAVGRACATNPIALIIPCHRVLGSDRSLTGYRWGKSHKSRLLEYEQARCDNAHSHAVQANFIAEDE